MLESGISGDREAIPKTTKENFYGENVKIVTERKLNPKWLTDAEKNEVVEKYKAGMSMGAIAREYEIHHTTIGRILRRMGIEIRIKRL